MGLIQPWIGIEPAIPHDPVDQVVDDGGDVVNASQSIVERRCLLKSISSPRSSLCSWQPWSTAVASAGADTRFARRAACGARTSRLIASVRPSRSVCCPAWCWEARLLRRCRRGLVCPTRRQSPVGRTARIRRPASQHTRLPVAAPRRRRRPICRPLCLSNPPDLDAGLRCEEIHIVHQFISSIEVPHPSMFGKCWRVNCLAQFTGGVGVFETCAIHQLDCAGGLDSFSGSVSWYCWRQGFPAGGGLR
jgi:hypothetical protein